MSEKIYRLNEGGLLLYVREGIPTQWRVCAFVCQRRYTIRGCVPLYVREDIPTDVAGVCFCMSEKIYRLNGGGLVLYIREDIPIK